MDGQRFDDLTRALASGTSRRRVLQGMAGGAVGALAAVFGRRRAGAQNGCGDVNDACFSDFDCCGFNESGSSFCFRPQNRRHGKCICSEGFVTCGDECVDPFLACDYGQTFDESTCQCTCPDGREPCGGEFGECCDLFEECISPYPGVEFCFGLIGDDIIIPLS